MSAEDDAYEAARRLIAEAKEEGADSLDLSVEATHALDRLPHEIADLQALRTLSLDNTQIADLIPIAGLTGLSLLSLTSTQIADLTPLAGLTGLSWLSLTSTQIADLTPLAGLTGLSRLYLDNTQITDLTPLAGLTGLDELYLDNTQIADLTPLAGLTGLGLLSLDSTLITDLTSLAGLTGLSSLSLESTLIADLTPLAGLTGLFSLSLGGTQIADLTPVAELTTLTWLSVNRTRIVDFGPLAGLTGLEVLSLSGTQIADLTPLAGLTDLSWLFLDGTQIADLTPLAGLTSLYELDLDNTQITDLRPLRQLLALAEDPHNTGLTFTSSAATRIDPRIAEISVIKDNATRARELFAYLETWVPPVPADSPVAPSYEVPDSGPITSRADPPEGGDEDQEELRKDLVRKASVLIEAIGGSNELAILSGAARHYQGQIDRYLPRIRLNLLYSAANSLRAGYEAHERATGEGRYTDQLPPRAAAALADLVETHALFFMGFPDAAEVHARMLSGLTGGRNHALVSQAEPLVQSLNGKATVLDPEDQQAMADDLAGAKGEGPSAEIAEKRLVGRLTNMLGAIGRKAYLAAKAGTGIVVAYDIPAWILGEKTVILTFLKVAQGAFAAWFDVLAQILMKL